MATSQPYQSLSYALHEPRSSTNNRPSTSYRQENSRDDANDEGVVEEQLNTGARSGADTPSPAGINAREGDDAGAGPEEEVEEPDPKRPRSSSAQKTKSSSKRKRNQVSNVPTLPTVNPQNQEYYEFQWRVLNLCGEFYSAAAELVKSTAPLVIAQSFQLGPGVKVDPIAMLTDAKRICDTLLANPSQLVTNPPPVQQLPTFSYPGFPGYVQAGPATVINNPGSFSIPLGTTAQSGSQPTTSAPLYDASYYAWPAQGAQNTSADQVAAAVANIANAHHPQPAASTSAGPSSSSAGQHNAMAVGANQGQWSAEELDKIKRVAEQSKNRPGNESGEIDWDHVISAFGGSRTRHQILIKATSLGLKESSGKGTATTAKRRRDRETETPVASQAPAPHSTSSTGPSQTNSPEQTTRQPQSSTTAGMPWPMPTVAASAGTDQITSFYRPRPQNGADKSSSSQGGGGATHEYMYQPNGSTSVR